MYLQAMKKIIIIFFLILGASVLAYGYPIVGRQTSPAKMDNGILFTGRIQDAEGHLSFSYRLPQTRSDLVKYCGSVADFMEVAKLCALGALDEILKNKKTYDVELDLLVNYGKSWHYLYYDSDGKFVGKVSIDRTLLVQ